MTPDHPIFDWMRSPENRNTLVLMRSVPSGGKSYRARELSGNDPSVIFSADLFFGKTRDEYVANWHKDKLSKAHHWCQWNTANAMGRQLPLVIVDNTNTMIREMMPYFDMAVKYQYKVQIEEPTSPWWKEISVLLLNKVENRAKIEAAARMLAEKSLDSHCVPYESILKMLLRFHTNVTLDDLIRVYCRRQGAQNAPPIVDQAPPEAP